ncbi:MAG: hypothetical protein QXD55_01455 [Candidatus Aenigmatarchaeota archaeon]
MEEKVNKKFSFKFPKLSKADIASIIFLIIFVILVSLPNYMPKNGCEVARPAYKCASFKDVMIENCVYWGNYNCDTQADISLPQIEWYIDNLCELQNKYHNSGLDCSNLKKACNQITGNQTCPIGY